MCSGQCQPEPWLGHNEAEDNRCYDSHQIQHAWCSWVGRREGRGLSSEMPSNLQDRNEENLEGRE